MNSPVRAKTFKSGNSEAVRLPKGIGFGIGVELRIERRGDVLTMRRIPSDAEEAERLARFRAAMIELARLGPVGEIGEREPIEFPDRPGLY